MLIFLSLTANVSKLSCYLHSSAVFFKISVQVSLMASAYFAIDKFSISLLLSNHNQFALDCS